MTVNPSILYAVIFGIALGVLLMYYVNCRRESAISERWEARMRTAGKLTNGQWLRRSRENEEWGAWQICTEGQAARVAGVANWQVYQVGMADEPKCAKCGGSGWKPHYDANGERVWLPLMNDALPCECGALARKIAAEKAGVSVRDGGKP